MIDRFPAVALLGPRQASKTTLARPLADALSEKGVYLDLELPSDRAKLADVENSMVRTSRNQVFGSLVKAGGQRFQDGGIHSPWAAQLSVSQPLRFSGID